MKKHALYIFIISILAFGNCASQAPFTGTFAYDPGAHLQSYETYDATTGCVSDNIMLTSSKKIYKFTPEFYIFEYIRYDGLDCANRVEVIRTTYRHKFHELIEVGTVSTDINFITTESGTTVYAYPVDLILDKVDFYCDTETCVNEENIYYADQNFFFPYNGYCNISVTPSQWIDVTSCEISSGNASKDPIYRLIYHDWINLESGIARFYWGSSYSSPGGIVVDEMTPDTRPYFIETAWWYNQITQ